MAWYTILGSYIIIFYEYLRVAISMHPVSFEKLAYKYKAHRGPLSSDYFSIPKVKFDFDAKGIMYEYNLFEYA